MELPEVFLGDHLLNGKTSLPGDDVVAGGSPGLYLVGSHKVIDTLLLIFNLHLLALFRFLVPEGERINGGSFAMDGHLRAEVMQL